MLAHRPIGLEGMDNVLVDDMKKKGLHPQDIQLLPDGGGWLLVEFGGQSKEEADDQAHRLMAALQQQPNPPSMKLYDDPKQEQHIWLVRRTFL